MKDAFKSRKAFSFYRSYWEVINDLSNEQAGELMKGVANYQFTGEPPVFKGVLNAVWKGFETLVDVQVGGYLNGLKTDNSNKKSKSTPNRGAKSSSKSPPNDKEQREKNKEENTPPIIPQDLVEQLYSLYPTKCELRNRSTGKSAKDKQTLERRIKEFGFEYVKNSISFYLEDCKKNEVMLKNFSTLLNNLPDPPSSYTTERTVVKFNNAWDDNNGNHCADYVDENGNIYQMKDVEFNMADRKHYLKRKL